MATHLVLRPGGLRGARFIDSTQHRADTGATPARYQSAVPLDWVKPWLMIERTARLADVERVYLEVLGGRTLPEKAHVLSIAEP
jgi:hypothetical protein